MCDTDYVEVLLKYLNSAARHLCQESTGLTMPHHYEHQ